MLILAIIYYVLNVYRLAYLKMSPEVDQYDILMLKYRF